jgi:hypothetical protein
VQTTGEISIQNPLLSSREQKCISGKYVEESGIRQKSYTKNKTDCRKLKNSVFYSEKLNNRSSVKTSLHEFHMAPLTMGWKDNRMCNISRSPHSSSV